MRSGGQVGWTDRQAAARPRIWIKTQMIGMSKNIAAPHLAMARPPRAATGGHRLTPQIPICTPGLTPRSHIAIRHPHPPWHDPIRRSCLRMRTLPRATRQSEPATSQRMRLFRAPLRPPSPRTPPARRQPRARLRTVEKAANPKRHAKARTLIPPPGRHPRPALRERRLLAAPPPSHPTQAHRKFLRATSRRKTRTLIPRHSLRLITRHRRA